MKKIFIFLILSFCIINNAHSRDKIIVTAAAPTIYAQTDGETLKGPSIEIINLIFNDINIPVDVQSLPFKRAVELLKVGEVDVILTFFYNEERAEYAEFSEPYDFIHTSIIVKKGKAFKYETWDDMKGKLGLVVRGYSEGKEFDEFAKQNLQLEEKTDIEQILMMLEKDRGDFAIIKKYDAIIEAKKIGHIDKIEILPKPVASNKLYMGFSKKSPFLKHLPEVNKKIKQLNEEGITKKIIEKGLNP